MFHLAIRQQENQYGCDKQSNRNCKYAQRKTLM